jgi:hypothetical protein
MQRSKQRTIATILVLSGLLVFLVSRQNFDVLRIWTKTLLKPAQAQTVESTVYRMLDSARKGDISGYLNSFSGKMRDQLAQAVRETSKDKFQQYLETENAKFTGVALARRRDDSEPDLACIRLEYVYNNRNETQDLYLRSIDGAWKIVRVDGADQIKMLIPYGTLVTN